MLIDAKNRIVGRLGTFVAKKALLGEKIDIINAEQAVISGKRAEVLGKFKQRVERGTWAKGPHYKRDPDMLLKNNPEVRQPLDSSRHATQLLNYTMIKYVYQDFFLCFFISFTKNFFGEFFCFFVIWHLLFYNLLSNLAISFLL